MAAPLQEIHQDAARPSANMRHCISGSLFKASRHLEVWRERFVVLSAMAHDSPAMLRTYRHRPNTEQTQPTETILLQDASVIHCPPQIVPRCRLPGDLSFFVVVINKSNRAVFFSVESERLASEWVCAIADCITGTKGLSPPNSSTYREGRRECATQSLQTSWPLNGSSDPCDPPISVLRRALRLWRLKSAKRLNLERRLMEGQFLSTKASMRNAFSILLTNRKFQEICRIAAAPSVCGPCQLSFSRWHSLSVASRPLRVLEARNVHLAQRVGELQGTLHIIACERRLAQLTEMELDLQLHSEEGRVEEPESGMKLGLDDIRIEAEQLRELLANSNIIGRAIGDNCDYVAFQSDQAEEYVPYFVGASRCLPEAASPLIPKSPYILGGATPLQNSQAVHDLHYLKSDSPLKMTGKGNSSASGHRPCHDDIRRNSSDTELLSVDLTKSQQPTKSMTMPWWKTIFGVSKFDDVLS